MTRLIIYLILILGISSISNGQTWEESAKYVFEELNEIKGDVKALEVTINGQYDTLIEKIGELDNTFRDYHINAMVEISTMKAQATKYGAAGGAAPPIFFALVWGILYKRKNGRNGR